MRDCPGTRGYDIQTAEGYERLRFEDVHPALDALLPSSPVDILDVGAGSGRDAAHLAGSGHRVVAVEPHGPYRRLAASLHPHPGILWIDDALPGLERVAALGRRFSVILLSAVWMHLDPRERERAMPRLAALLRPDGLLHILTRHGPPPPGRVMHAVPPDETAALARRAGLSILGEDRSGDLLGRGGVSWSSMTSAGPGYRPVEAVKSPIGPVVPSPDEGIASGSMAMRP